MTTRNIPVTLADLDALLAIRGVIADAAHHPGRAAAIDALDRLKAAWEAHEAAEDNASAAEPPAFVGSVDEFEKFISNGRLVVGRAVVKLESSGSVTTVVSRGIGDGPAVSLDAEVITDEAKREHQAAVQRRPYGPLGPPFWTGPVPQRQCNHTTFDTKREPAATGVLAEVAALFGYRTLEVGRDDLSRVWRISARTTESAMLTVEVADRDLAASTLPTTPWFDAFAKLALQLEVPDHASKLPALVEILACAIEVAPRDESEAEFRARLRLPPRPAPDKAMMPRDLASPAASTAATR